LFPTIFLFHHWFCDKVELIKQKLQNEVYEESRCYPLCCFSTCFLFMFSFVFYSSISLLVFMLTLIFIYCILTFFFFVYHFSCYNFVLFFFTCLLFFVFLIVVQIFTSLAKFSFLLHLLKCLCPQNSSSLLNFVGAKHVIILLHCLFIHLSCNVLVFFVYFYLFIYFSRCCASFFYYWHMCFLFSYLYIRRSWWSILFFFTYWCLATYFFALYFVDACISCNIFYLYCILFKCTFLVSLPLKEAFEWKKTSFWKHNWRHIHKLIITIPQIS